MRETSMRSVLVRVGRSAVAVLACAALCAAQTVPGTSSDRPSSDRPSDQPQQQARVTQGPTVQYVDDAFAVITWSTDVQSDSRVFYGTDPNNLNQVAESGEMNRTAHRVDANNLKPSTTYYFQVDLGQAGTNSPDQPMLSFNTVAPGAAPLNNVRPQQVSAPEQQTAGARITRGPTIQYADDHSAVISWSTEESAPSIVYYGTDANNLTRTAETAGGTTFHRVHLSNLNPQTTYYFVVDSGQGRMGSGPASTFQTVAAGAPPLYDRAPARYSDQATGAALGQRPSSPPPPQPDRSRGNTVEVPAGVEVRMALDDALSSKTSHPGDSFTATVTDPVRASDGAVAIPAGTKVRGQVTEAESGKTLPTVRGRGKLNLRFIDLTMPNGTSVPLEATLSSVNNSATGEEGEIKSSTKGSTAAKDVGIGAGVGTVAGLIFGGALKGLLIGAVAGGGYVLATKGKDVELPAKTGLTMKLDRSLAVPVAPAGYNR
ncbi:MAG: fibronectin type III domain-containing protein [Acidobacteria bacterium]|nr:fibronectin type III domain-containing protein [Acidobacteriota bacterium]